MNIELLKFVNFGIHFVQFQEDDSTRSIHARTPHGSGREGLLNSAPRLLSQTRKDLAILFVRIAAELNPRGQTDTILAAISNGEIKRCSETREWETIVQRTWIRMRKPFVPRATYVDQCTNWCTFQFHNEREMSLITQENNRARWISSITTSWHC